MTDFTPLLTPDALVIYPSRTKLLLLAIGAAGFVAVGWFIWNTEFVEVGVIAILCVTFFGTCFLYAVTRLIWRSPSLIISPSGMYDGSSALGGYVFRWSEIEDAYISSIRASTFRRQRFITIRLKNTEEFLARVSPLKSRLMRFNIGLGGAPVSISAATLPMSLEEVLQHIQEYVPALAR